MNRCQSSVKFVDSRDASLLRRGFVLLTVLMLVALGALLLTRYSLQSLRLAAQARRSADSVSDRWARWSAMQVGMMQAEQLLVSAQESNQAATSVVIPITIREQSLSLRIVDLDCAVNVNTVARQSGAQGVRRLLSSQFVTFDTLPIMSAPDKQARLVFDSWGKLLRLDSAPAGSHVAGELQELHEHITCWGSGQLNVRRCSDDALALLGTAIGRKGLMDSIARERTKKPDASLNDLIAEAARGTDDAELLRSMLRDSSTAWCVTVEGPDGESDLLLIREAGFGQFSARTSVFSLR